MTPSDSKATESDTSRERAFALAVVQQLRDAGYQSVWAGGCVRDQMLGIEPHDYDVATSALPDQVQQVFGKRRTLAVGAAFGVIIVFAPDRRTQIEVATFRRDAEYSDGRHPDSVSFSSDREDAQRRDFTINGLFYDPIAERVIDYVGGEQDLERRVIRAIGNPADRFREDKLRMLRAVRFTATYEFSLDGETLAAVQKYAADLKQVSAERIAAELRRMMCHVNRALAVDLLLESGLLSQIIPQLTAVMDQRETDGRWQAVRESLRKLPTANVQGNYQWNETERFLSAMACLLHPVGDKVKEVCRALKLSKEESTGIDWLVTNVPLVTDAAARPWPLTQRLLVSPFAEQLVGFARAVAEAKGYDNEGWRFCQDALLLPDEELNPAPFISGDDLVAQGLRPGRQFKHILESVRDGQLLKYIKSKEDAIAEALRIAAQTDL